MVYFLADCLDLSGDGDVEVIKEPEGRFSLASRNDCLSQSTCTSTTFCPVVADKSSISTRSESLLTDELKFSRGIRTTAISKTLVPEREGAHTQIG
jgi:hypothetical protein